jgi:hypothetical protein
MREVRCAACNTLNRIQRYSVTRIPWCGKPECKVQLPEPLIIKTLRVLYPWRKWAAAQFILAMPLLFFIWLGTAGKGTALNPITTASTQTEEPCLAQPRPRHGDYLATSFEPRVAPFEAKTSRGSDYLIKLEDVRDGFKELSFFVHGGAPFETDVPLGVYILKYATGTTWCGPKELFGKQTIRKKGQTVLSFDRDYDGYSGNVVTLNVQPNGNFRTTYISATEF